MLRPFPIASGPRPALAPNGMARLRHAHNALQTLHVTHDDGLGRDGYAATELDYAAITQSDEGIHTLGQVAAQRQRVIVTGVQGKGAHRRARLFAVTNEIRAAYLGVRDSFPERPARAVEEQDRARRARSGEVGPHRPSEASVHV